MVAEYWPRIVDGAIESKLSMMGAISIEGPKACGKTATGLHFSKSHTFLSDPREPDILRTAKMDPRSIMSGEPPMLLDEWQLHPPLWDAVRYEVDERGMPGQFILTGSSVPTREGRIHTGSGRFGFITMRTMSMFESRESKGNVSLNGLFNGRPLEYGKTEHTLKDIAEISTRGGWPRAVIDGYKGPATADEYVEAICRGGISLSDGVKREPMLVRNILRSLARNASTLASMKTITSDVSLYAEVNGADATSKTVASYCNALRDTYVTEDLPACGGSARSKTPLRESPKRQLTDPSLVTSLLGLNADGLIDDLQTFGFVFETLCDRDLRVYADSFKGRIGHYHDSNDLEVDAIIETDDGRWGAIEMKLGGGYADDGAKNLNRLEDKIVKDCGRPPVFKMVLTSTGYTYKRDDGVIVVPIGCLGP